LENWIGRRARIVLSAHLAVVLIAAHHVAEREENAAKYEHQQKKTDNVPALQHAVSSAAAISTNRHLFPRTSE
jgi:hypothetical protein